jgi:hypothetical protein
MHFDAGWRDLHCPTHSVRASNIHIDAPDPRSNTMWDMQVIPGVWFGWSEELDELPPPRFRSGAGIFASGTFVAYLLSFEYRGRVLIRPFEINVRPAERDQDI